MGNLRFYINDRNGNLVNDPEQSQNYIEGAGWETFWPKGFGAFSGKIIRQNPLAAWAVKTGYELIVRDGGKIVYQGEIEAPDITTNSTALNAQGYYGVLARRKLRHRWVDTNLSRTEVPDEFIGDDVRTRGQQKWQLTRAETELTFTCAESSIGVGNWERYVEDYIMPAGQLVYRVRFDIKDYRSGEGFIFGIYNYTSASYEYFINAVNTIIQTPGQQDVTFTTPANRIAFVWGPYSTVNTYDINDWITIANVEIASSTDLAPTAKDVVEDVLGLAASEISTDYSRIADPGQSVAPFITLNDGFETADKIIQRAVNRGDASGNTYGFAIWSEEGSSDGKPLAVLEQRDVSAIDFTVSALYDCISFSYESSLDELFNYIVIEWIDTNGITRYTTPDDEPTLKDTASIATYGRREPPQPIKLEQSTAALALAYGERYLAYHLNPLDKAELSIQGYIPNAAGIDVPVSHVRAGCRVRVKELDKTLFIRRTRYDADTDTISLYSDLEPDDITQQALV